MPKLTAAFETAEASNKAKNLMVLAKDPGLADAPDSDLLSLARHDNKYFYKDDRKAEADAWPSLARYVQGIRMNKRKGRATCSEKDLVDEKNLLL